MAPLTLPPVGQIKRFVVAGLFNTGFSYAIYAVGLWFGLPYPVANFAALIGGVLMGFVTQGRFVFRRFETRRFPLFVLTWLLLWGLNLLLITMFLPILNGNAYLAGAGAMVVVVALSFIIQKYLVFADRSPR